MALVFPAFPNVGDRFPADPGTSGVTQYVWSGTTWNVVPPAVSLGVANQAAFNAYKWPTADGPAGHQLETDGAGNLSWQPQANLTFKPLDITPAPDSALKTFTLVEYGTTTAYSPAPSTNVQVQLGGVFQIPTTNYTVSGNQITFIDAPPTGAEFYAFSSVLA